jgi:alpha-1,2-mannosyltransferase
VAYIISFLGLLLISSDVILPNGKNFGFDFLSFWSGGYLARTGSPVKAYDMHALFEASKLAIPNQVVYYLWSYPPTYFFLVLPFSWLRYLPAYLLWSGIGLLFYAIVIYRLLPHPFALPILLAFPGVFINLMQGQNAFFITAFTGLGILWLERKPKLSGLSIGFLTFKPQLGLLWPLFLIVKKRWKVFIWALIGTIVMVGASVFFFGVESWRAFFEHIIVASRAIAPGELPLAKMPSVFASLRLLGVGSDWSLAIHSLVALIVILFVLVIGFSEKNLFMASAVMVAGSLLIFPHLNDHDLCLLAIPIALIARDAIEKQNWLPFEKGGLVIAWLTPLISSPISFLTKLPFGSLSLLLFFVLACRRTFTNLRSPKQIEIVNHILVTSSTSSGEVNHSQEFLKLVGNETNAFD